jgi:hypothetical protein
MIRALMIASLLSGCSAISQPCSTLLPDSLTDTVQPLTEAGSHEEILVAHMNNMENTNICYVQYEKPCCRRLKRSKALQK